MKAWLIFPIWNNCCQHRKDTEVIVPKIGEPVSEVEGITDDYYTKEIIMEEGIDFSARLYL